MQALSAVPDAIKSAPSAARLRQPCRPGTQCSRMSDFPWFDFRFAVFRSQLRRAKLLFSRSTEVRVLQRRYQGQLRRSKVAGNHRDVIFLSQLLRTNPRQFWRRASLAHTMLPPELRTLAAWDEYLAELTFPPAQPATQLPAPHTSQPPAPASCLDQLITEAEMRSPFRSCTMAGLVPSRATHQSCCAMPSWFPQMQTQPQSTSCCLAYGCSSTRHSARTRCPSPGRLHWSRQSSRGAMLQTQLTTDHLQWASL